MPEFASPGRVAISLLVASSWIALPASAQPVRISAAVELGELLSPEAEAFTTPQPLRQALLSSATGNRVQLASFPISPLERAEVELERVQIYAPGARVWRIDEDGSTPLPHSRRLFYRGASLDGLTEVAFSVDPESGTLRGQVAGPSGAYDLEPGDDGRQVIHLQDSSGTYSCTNEQLSADVVPDLDLGDAAALAMPSPDLPRLPELDPLPLSITGAASVEPEYQATLAVDTDVELLDEFFGDDTDSAADWIAELFNQMNLMYERDLSLRLLVGDTFLRVGTPGSDPWNVEGSGASSAALQEFASYWAANMGGVDRVFAMLLSGKSSSPNSGSGIARLGSTYCSSVNGYSVTQILHPVYLVTNGRLVGHEVGHNAGSHHTHCYSPPVDTCFNGEGGCYSGMTTTCPAAGSGTVMSYCHIGACFPISNRSEFHPTVIDEIFPQIEAAAPTCVEPLGLPSEIFTDGFESGDTSAWVE